MLPPTPDIEISTTIKEGGRTLWRPTLSNPSEGLKSGKRGGIKPLSIKLPRLRMPLDQDDRQMLGRVLIYSTLLLWAAVVLGAAVRVFVLIGFGGV